MPLVSAIETLLDKDYHLFLLTIACSTVSIYYTSDARFKIFDSHSRDLCGMPHPQLACVLLELQTLNEIIHYFQTFHNNSNALFELRGVRISEIHYDMIVNSPNVQLNNHAVNYQISDNTNIEQNGTNMTVLKCCCALSLYCICFSSIKTPGYWNSQTFDSFADHGERFYREQLNNGKQLTINDFPSTLQIYDAYISINFTLEKRGILGCTSVGCKLFLQKLIEDDLKGNTGFLMWISNYCLSCIFQNNNSNQKSCMKYYLTVFKTNTELEKFQTFQDVDSLIQNLFNTLKKQFCCNEIEYCIKFLSCLSNLSNTLRQSIMRKHISNEKKKISHK